jgi:nitroreductase
MIRDTVYESRTCRTFDESVPVTKETLTELIATVRLCPSARNLQPLKYRLVYEKEECEELLSLTKWGGALPDLKHPPDGHHPVAFVVVCGDTSLGEITPFTWFDAGIASQTLLLDACERGLSGCILGSIVPEEVSRTLLIAKKYKPMVVIALGKSEETAIVCNVPPSGSIAYYRDRGNLHYVPKRSVEELIIE